MFGSLQYRDRDVVQNLYRPFLSSQTLLHYITWHNVTVVKRGYTSCYLRIHFHDEIVSEFKRFAVKVLSVELKFLICIKLCM